MGQTITHRMDMVGQCRILTDLLININLPLCTKNASLINMALTKKPL